MFLHRHVQFSFRVILSHSRWTNSTRSGQQHCRALLTFVALFYEKEIDLPRNTSALGYTGKFKSAGEILETINKPDVSPLTLAMAFHDMKKLTGWDVDTFDVQSANRWCYKNKCTQIIPTN
jgi:hypothetical protein